MQERPVNILPEKVAEECPSAALSGPLKLVRRDWPPVTTGLKRLSGTRFYFFLFLGFAVISLSGHLGLPPLWGSEGRWAVIARSMLRSGDLLSPVLGMSAYWDKPLLSYWQILPLSYLTGDVSEFTVRFPSLVWAVILLLLTYLLAKRWFDEETAVASVGILATTYFFVFWGRNAQVEMSNAAMILLCLWYFLKHKLDRGYRWVYVLGAMMGLGANMKGPVVYGVSVFCILVLSAIRKDWSWMPPFRVLLPAGLLSIILCLSLPAISGISSATREPLAMIWRENVLRFLGLHDHKEPFYTYLVKVFYIAAPWSLILPAAVIQSLMGVKRRISQIPEALILFAAILIFFTLSGSRRIYYLLPILPFVAILVAHTLREFGNGRVGPVMEGFLKGAGIFLGLGMIALFGASVIFLWGFTGEDRFLLAGASALLGIIGGGIMLVSTMKKYVWGMIGAMLAILLVYVLGVIPLTAEEPNVRAQAAKVRVLNKQCGFLNIDDAKLVFYLDKPYRFFYDHGPALEWATQAKGVVITPGDFSDQGWECVVKGHGWKAVVPRKSRP
jgi:4-amino-4-deoxy-L-arabinose transferase-like glycosyltransferase